MEKLVTIKIERVRQIDNPDGFLGGNADYYCKVNIDGTWLKSTRQKDSPDWRPNWTFIRSVVGNRNIPIVIELWDRDITGGDDLCDINPNRGLRTLKLFYNTSTGRISGDLSAAKGTRVRARGAGESYRAEIWFRISHRVPRMPKRLPEVWASDCPIKLLWRASASGNDLKLTEQNLAAFNDLLYSCTDGQWRIGRFMIQDERSLLSSTGRGVGHIHRTGTHGAHGHADGRPNNPKHWEVNEKSTPEVYVMEFLHSWTGLKDEYEVSQGGPRTNCPATKALRDETKACIMDGTYGKPKKLCRPETHNPNTEQGNVRKMDCYSWLKKVMHAAGKTRFKVPQGHVPGPDTAPTLRFVYLTITNVNQISNPDGLFSGNGDYYVRVRIDGLWYAKSTHVEDRKKISPNWFFGFAFSSDRHRKIPIRIELWDHDKTSGDDRCDINPRKRKKVLDIVYNTATGRITGDITGSRNRIITAEGSGDSNRAKLKFRINSR